MLDKTKTIENVKLVCRFFNEKGLWYQIMPNQKSESCKDAANKRNRFGNRGIPILDELKSNFGFYFDQEYQKQYVLIHCRGNQLLDMCKINSILSGTFQRISVNDLSEEFNLSYGIINPMISIKNQDILQLFDLTVLEKYLPPYTMITNAGDFEWGLEFKPKELIDALPNVKVTDLIQDKTKPELRIHKIGILTGNSPESGIMLWELINTQIRKKLGPKFMGDFSFPRVLIESVPEMGLSMELELREKETEEAVLDAVERLCDNGSTLIAIACNTTQYFSEKIKAICSKYDAQFISMLKVVTKHLRKEKITEFDFLGIQYVTDFIKWSAFKTLKESYSVNLPSESDLKEINELAFEVKRKKISGKGVNKLRDLINNATETEYVIIALTELSILLASQKRQKKSAKVYIDTLSLLAEALAEEFVTGISPIYSIPKSK